MKVPPVTELKKADLNKIKKQEEALAKLKLGEERYYVITNNTLAKRIKQFSLYMTKIN